MLRIQYRLIAHQLSQSGLNGLNPGFGSCGAGVEQVPHQLGVNRAVGAQEDMIYIEPEHVLSIRQAGGEFPCTTACFDALGGRIKRRRADTFLAIATPRKHSQHQYLGTGMPLANEINNRPGAGKNFFRGMSAREIPIIGIICSDQEHRHLGRLCELQLAILEVPQNLLSTLPIHPKIDGSARLKVPLPHRLVGSVFTIIHVSDGVRDGIADECQIVVAGLNGLYLFHMTRIGVLGRVIRVPGLRLSEAE